MHSVLKDCFTIMTTVACILYGLIPRSSCFLNWFVWLLVGPEVKLEVNNIRKFEIKQIREEWTLNYAVVIVEIRNKEADYSNLCWNTDYQMLFFVAQNSSNNSLNTFFEKSSRTHINNEMIHLSVPGKINTSHTQKQ